MKHSNLTHKHLQIMQTRLFLNIQIIYIEFLQIIIFKILQKYTRPHLAPTSSQILLQNHKCGGNGMTQTGHLAKV
jgi:hypothetical protein